MSRLSEHPTHRCRHLITQGIQPDAPVYNSLMEVLWQSGILLAQARAMQLWTVANRSGHFR